ncbi:MAG: hypothetical protein RR806_03115 [Oscillospiraceae bacterium]
MFKIDKKTNAIYLTRGDTAPFNVDILDAKNKRYTPTDTDIFILTVKKNATDNLPLIFKNNVGKASFIFESADTQKLDIGEYVYDIQLKFDEKTVNTIVPIAHLYLCEEVGRE